MTILLKAKPAVSDLDYALVSDERELSEGYQDYFSDESKMSGGLPASIAFPANWEQLSALMNKLHSCGASIRVSGSRTGISGGAVPQENDNIISLTKMKSIGEIRVDEAADEHFISVGAGVTLAELNEMLLESGSELFFPVDPTETSASFGGMCAANASGARSYFYGSIRPWISWLRIILADGSVLELRRGEQKITKRALKLQSSEGVKELCLDIDIPVLRTKHSTGVSFAEGMDPIDLFIGSEGRLGIVSDIELKLIRRPAGTLFLLQLFETDEQALHFVNLLDESEVLQPFAIEFCDGHSLRFIEQSPAAKDCRAIQMLSPEYGAAVYVELPWSSEEGMVDTMEQVFELIQASGGEEEASFAGTEPKDWRDMKVFRHAVPETINSILARRKSTIPTLHKIATDMSVPRDRRGDIYRFYRDKLTKEGLQFAIFGHAGDGHFHVNILPRKEDELTKAKNLYRLFAKEIVEMGGSVSGEHGIGVLKRSLLEIQFDIQTIESMKKICQFFDPDKTLNPGVLC